MRWLWYPAPVPSLPPGVDDVIFRAHSGGDS
jgi:hypothetical protein